MELKDLYRDVILDHNRKPRNFGRLDEPAIHAQGHNPLCGDRLTVSLRLEGDRIEDIRIEISNARRFSEIGAVWARACGLRIFATLPVAETGHRSLRTTQTG